MASTGRTFSTKNFYADARNDPEAARRRQQRIEAVEARVAELLSTRAGRKPDWRHDEILKVDAIALRDGLRCVMWDDRDGGFYMLVAWNWVLNVPACTAPAEGTWAAARELLMLPLIDPALASEDVAPWLDENTMTVHSRIAQARREGALAAYDPELDPPELKNWRYVLRNDQEMQALLRAGAEPIS